MVSKRRLWAVVALGLMVLAACGPGQTTPNRPAQTEQPSVAAQRVPTLVIVTRAEPDTLAAKPLVAAGSGLGDTHARRLFNAGIALKDASGTPRPYLVEALPRLNTPTWQTFPDGRMETVYPIKPSLTWHDGKPLVAADFVLAWRVYATPEFGAASLPPLREIDEVVATDSRTVTIRWRRPFADADALQAEDLQPLPAHLLQAGFDADTPEAFASRSFWTTEYVGLGPYQLTRWEPGSFVEARAVPGHALGRAAIESVRLQIIGDSNTVLTNLLAGEAHVTLPFAIYPQQGQVLKREWPSAERGSLFVVPASWRKTHFQLRPELASPRALLDVRVRKALAHAVDRQAYNEAVYDGDAMLADFMIPSTVPYYAQVDPAIAKYPTDLRRSEELMRAAGFAKGADGTFVGGAGARFATEARSTSTADLQKELSIMASQWRQAGFEVQEAPVTLAQAQDGQVRASFPGLQNWGGGIGEAGLQAFTTSSIPSRDNRWVGNNQGGWSNPAYDGLIDVFNSTLDRGERTWLIGEMARLLTDDAVFISLHYSVAVIASAGALTGPAPFSYETTATWNIHEWQLRAGSA
jgi:peptide/nickel transport system substrate-binding protein